MLWVTFYFFFFLLEAVLSVSRFSQSLNGWCELQQVSHWQEGNTQALTCKMGISTSGVTFSMKSRHLAQGILESLAQTDSLGPVCMCVSKKIKFMQLGHIFFPHRSSRKTTPKSNSVTLRARMSWPRGSLSGSLLMWQTQWGSGWWTDVSGTLHIFLAPHVIIYPAKEERLHLVMRVNGLWEKCHLLASSLSVLDLPLRDEFGPGDQRALSLQHFQA